MTNHLLIKILSICIIITNCSASQILVIAPTPSYSHQQPFLVLSNALAEKGHTVTLITTNPSKEQIKNIKEIDISSLYKDWEEMQKLEDGVNLQERDDDHMKLAKQICFVCDYIIGLFFKKPEIKQLIRDLNGTKYDLIVYEGMFYGALLGFKHLIGNPPAIAMVTLHPFQTMDGPMGNPVIPSYIPSIFFPHDDKMSLWERIMNLYVHVYNYYITETCIKPVNEKYYNQVFGNLPNTVEELEYNRSLLLISTDLTTGYPRPVQPNTIYVGPLHLKQPKPLPQDLQKWMDEAEEGVIYFSLGSNVKGTSVSEEKRAAFIKAFKQFPKTRVLWKWEADEELPGKPDNVLVRKWLPQQSILAHPKCRLFISQVGLQSFHEAINHGVPMLGLPVFGDQLYNAKKLERSGAGLRVEFTKIKYEIIYEKLKSLLTESSFKENMDTLSRISKDRMMSPVDTAIWWVEYVLRHKGTPHLRPASNDLTLYQYYMLDILAILVFISLLVSSTIYYIIVKLTILLISNKSNKLKTN